MQLLTINVHTFLFNSLKNLRSNNDLSSKEMVAIRGIGMGKVVKSRQCVENIWELVEDK